MAAASSALGDLGLTVEGVDRWRAAQGRPALSTLDDQQRAQLLAYLRSSDQARGQIAESVDG